MTRSARWQSISGNWSNNAPRQSRMQDYELRTGPAQGPELDSQDKRPWCFCWSTTVFCFSHFDGPDFSLRCDGQRSALHRPTQCAAMAHAAHCVFHPIGLRPFTKNRVSASAHGQECKYAVMLWCSHYDAGIRVMRTSARKGLPGLSCQASARGNDLQRYAGAHRLSSP